MVIKHQRLLTNGLEVYQDWDVLGEGNNAVVYKHPKRPGVVKLWTKSNFAYNEYLKRVLQNQHLASVPKVFGGIIEYDNHYAVRMEELETRETGFVYDGSSYEEYDEAHSWQVRYPENREEANALTEAVSRKTVAYIRKANLEPPLKSALWRLARWMKGTGYGSDIRYGPNIMQRTDGTSVVIDPWYD